MNHWSNLSPLENNENNQKSNKYNDKIKQNHTTKILRFLDHLNNTNTDLCKFATKSYCNNVEVFHGTHDVVSCPQ